MVTGYFFKQFCVLENIVLLYTYIFHKSKFENTLILKKSLDIVRLNFNFNVQLLEQFMMIIIITLYV
jgi:hypothetical protein